MAAIDIKNFKFRLVDGTLGTLVNQGITYTQKRHTGTRDIKVTLVNPGTASSPLNITVTYRSIVVSLATDASSNVTTTATQLVTALNANTDVTRLVTVTGSGAAPLTALAATALTKPNYMEMKLGEGNASWTESTPREFVKDRGLLDSVRDGDEEPMDVSLDAMFEFIESAVGATTPTFVEALERIGPASAWLSTLDDCEPYGLDIELDNAPTTCGSTPKEVIVLPEFLVESKQYGLDNSMISLSGKCNATKAIRYRYS